LKECFPRFLNRGRDVVDVNGPGTTHNKRFHEFNPLK
jgi:hypothetical protein